MSTRELPSFIFPGPSPSPPTTSAEWHTHWQRTGMPWRTEPEIDHDRQQFLRKRQELSIDWRHGAYPFASVQLTRADVEWLLAQSLPPSQDVAPPTDGVRLAVETTPAWRGDIDLRGADLRLVNLSELPLTGVLAGLTASEWSLANDEQRDLSLVHLDRANLQGAHLEGALLTGAVLIRANLIGAHLEGATLTGAQLERAQLQEAHLEGASLVHAQAQNAEAMDVHLIGADLHEAQLRGMNLTGADLRGALVWSAHLEGAQLRGAHLEGFDMPEEKLLRLRRWCPEFPQNVPPADLRGASFDTATDIFGITLGDRRHGVVRVADLRWGDAIVTVVAWSQVTMLGDERVAREPRLADGRPKSRSVRIAEHETAIRANRQLAIVLQAQGLNEQAIRFLYRTQLLRRQLLWWQVIWGAEGRQQGAPGRFGLWQRMLSLSALGISLLLDLISGYGAKLGRCFVAYLVTVVAFAAAHYLVGLHTGSHPLSVFEAFAMSIQSLHGRNFSFQPTGPQVALNTAEAVVGLILEALIVAVITRRILGLG